VRGAERPRGDKAAPRTFGSEGVDIGDLERLVRREGREEPWKTSREHRLAGTGRADEEEIVASRRGDLQGTLRAPLNFGEVGLGRKAGRGQGRWWRHQRFFAAQVSECLSEVDRAHGRDGVEQRGLRGVRGRQKDLGQAEDSGELGNSDGTSEWAKRPIQAELAAEEPAGQSFGGQKALGREESERDRQVEVYGLLGQLARRKRDSGAAGDRNGEAFESCADPGRGFARCRGGQKAVDLELQGVCRVNSNVDINEPGFDSQEGGAGEGEREGTGSRMRGS